MFKRNSSGKSDADEKELFVRMLQAGLAHGRRHTIRDKVIAGIRLNRRELAAAGWFEQGF